MQHYAIEEGPQYAGFSGEELKSSTKVTSQSGEKRQRPVEPLYTRYPNKYQCIDLNNVTSHRAPSVTSSYALP